MSSFQKVVYLMLSGGVDSSVTAFILKQLGFKVVGVYMLKWWNPKLGDNCPVNQDLEYVFRVGRVLNIPVYIIDLRDIYKKLVLNKVLSDFKQGITPNPDTLCNKYIKFGAFINEIKKIAKNDDFLIATGHYALNFNKELLKAVVGGQNFDLANWGKKLNINLNTNNIFLPVDPYKDQTYFLYDIRKKVLSRVMFPLGILKKEHVRQLAKELELKTEQRKESSGICFIGDIELSKFLQQQLGYKKGKIVDIKTNAQVGEHNGLWLYTIGQRKGLNIGGVSPAYYVVKKDYKNNILYVAQGRFNEYIFSKQIKVLNANWHVDINNWLNKKIGALIRYRSMPYNAVLQKNKNKFVVNFISNKFARHENEKLGFWAKAAGQAVVLYSNVFFRQGIEYNFNVKSFVNDTRKVYGKLFVENINKLPKTNRNVFMLGGGIIA